MSSPWIPCHHFLMTPVYRSKPFAACTFRANTLDTGVGSTWLTAKGSTAGVLTVDLSGSTFLGERALRPGPGFPGNAHQRFMPQTAVQ